MSTDVQHPPHQRATRVVNVFAALIWLCALGVLGRLILAWADGRLVPGENSSMGGLLAMFLIISLIPIGGLYLCVRAWRKHTRLGWQVVSAIAALVALMGFLGD